MEFLEEKIILQVTVDEDTGQLVASTTAGRQRSVVCPSREINEVPPRDGKQMPQGDNREASIISRFPDSRVLLVVT